MHPAVDADNSVLLDGCTTGRTVSPHRRRCIWFGWNGDAGIAVRAIDRLPSPRIINDQMFAARPAFEGNVRHHSPLSPLVECYPTRHRRTMGSTPHSAPPLV